MDVDPDPNGVHRVFAVPDGRLVEGSLQVYLQGEEITPDEIDLERGAFTIPAPDDGQTLVASYNFQWFTDEQLDGFLQEGAQLLKYEGVTDGSLSVGLRTPVTSLGAYYAYLSKAAEAAPALGASTAGFTSDTSKEHPYWMNLARMAFEMFEKELKTFNEDTTSSVRPAMAFVTYKVPRYVPRS